MKIPGFTLDDIKFKIDKKTFIKAINLYEQKKITKIKEGFHYYQAEVLGTYPYQVYVDIFDFTEGSCDCYLGQRDILCKHMIALAIYMVKQGQDLNEDDKKFIEGPICSNKLGDLSEEEEIKVKEGIRKAMRYIKAYEGPSRIWFAYQNSLEEGCRHLSKILSSLPVCLKSAEIIVALLIKLDNKLGIGGVDDSDGTVGNFIEGAVDVLLDYVKLDRNCLKAFKVLKNRETCFGWEERLIKLLN